MTRRLVAAIGTCAVAASLLAGCSASSSPAGRSSTPAPTTPSSSAPDVTGTPPVATDPTTPTPSSTTGSPTTSGSSSPSPTGTASSSPVPAQSTCTDLTVRVLIGSAAPGYEFAALEFVNDGSSACTLVGVPTVTLLRKGSPTGSVSQPSSDRARFSTYRLAPGDTAESRLKDFSDCNAPLSDTVRVVAPGSTISATRPGELRACRLVVYPLGAPE